MIKNMEMNMNNKPEEAKNITVIGTEDFAEMLAMIASLGTKILSLPSNRGNKMLTDAAVDCLETVEKIICKSDIPAAFIPNDFGKDDEPAKDEPTKDGKLDETTPSTLVEMFPRDLYERLTELCDNVIMLNETVENLCEMLIWEAHYEV